MTKTTGIASQDITVIAKAVRKEIKKDKALEGVKVSVRISRYSMGRSLDASIKAAPFMIVNPQFVAWDREDDAWDNGRPARYTLKAQNAIDRIRDIIDQYNYDNSDSQTDYYDVNFASQTTVDWEVERDHTAAIKAAQDRGLTINAK